MKHDIELRLNRLIGAHQQHLLGQGLKGLEKESLRVTPDATIAQTKHPRSLGSALTHSYITTDYSEALIELITPPFADCAETLQFLRELHQLVYRAIGEELLWPASMPCEIEGDLSIPIAEYGSSNIGRMKHVYRQGLAWRYGRAMQAIAGIHFNYSINEALWPVWHELHGKPGDLRDFISDQYFGVIRNVKRYGWMILYLLGGSPALAKSFFTGREALGCQFETFDAHTLFKPYATSLRMSDIGYRNDSQSELEISCNSLDEYIRSLTQAVNTPYPPYDDIGIKVNGEYRQLNSNMLQISNEFYSSIRPKQVAETGEKPLLALRRRGLAYLELRSVDLGGVHPLGVSLDQLRFLELFMLYCFLMESPPLAGQEKQDCYANSLAVACCGRTPGFSLRRRGQEVSLRHWLREGIDDMAVIADILDMERGDGAYATSLALIRHSADDVGETPSARMLQEMRSRNESYTDYGLRWAREHRNTLTKPELPPSRLAEFDHAAAESLARQASMEASDNLDFDLFLAQYFAQSAVEDIPDTVLGATGTD